MTGVEVASAYVALIPKMQGLQKEIRRAFEKTNMRGEGKRQGGLFSSAFAGGVGGIVALGATKALAVVKNQVTDIVNSFSNLEDATGAAGVVFGDSMGTIINQANNAAKTMGLTKAQVIDAANTFGTFGKAAGLSGPALADFSTQMTQLASDLSSFKGGSPEEAITAIGAAMRGESEPIRRYGVLLDDATLKARALKLGLISSTKDALSPANKTLAAQAEILAQTTDAMGDFERTQFSTANTAKAFDATLANFKTTLGGLVAPAFSLVKSAATGVLSGFSLDLESVAPKVEVFWNRVRAGLEIFKTGEYSGVFADAFGVSEDDPLVQKVLGWKDTLGQFAEIVKPIFSSVKEAFDGVAPVFAQAFEKLAPVLSELTPHLSSVALAFNPIGVVFQAIVPLLPTLVDGFTTFASALLSAVIPVLPQIAEIFNELIKVVSDVLAQVLPIVADLLTQIAENAGQLFSALMPAIIALMPVITQIITLIGDVLVAVLPAVVPLVQTIIDVIIAIMPFISELIEVIGQVISALIESLAPIIPVVGEALTQFGELFQQIMTDYGIPFIKFLISVITPAIQSLVPVIQTAFSVISNIISGVLEFIKGIIQTALSILRGDWSGAWEGIKTATSGAINTLMSIIGGVPALIGSVFSGAGNLLWNAGKAIIQGFIDGISYMFNSVKNTLSSLTNLLPSWKGPAPKDARILYGAGKLVIGGFRQGLESEFTKVHETLADFTESLNVQPVFTPEIDTFDRFNRGASSGRGFGNVYIETVVNPVAEPTSVSANRQLQKIALMGDF